MKQTCSRRTLLGRAISTCATSTPTPNFLLKSASAISAILAPQRSDAVVMESFLVASAVAGLISSSKNKGGGAIGAMLSASLDYQRVLAKQLQDMQLGLAQMLAQVNTMPDKFVEILKRDRLERLQEDIGGSIDLYNAEVRKGIVSFSTSYQEWTKDDTSRAKMLDISIRLDNALTKLSRGGWIDAATSFYFPPAMFANLGALAFRGANDLYLRSTAQQYLDVMQRSLDPNEPNSIATSLFAHTNSFQDVTLSLKKRGVTLPPVEQTAPFEIVLGEVRIVHYQAPQPEISRCGRGRRGGGGARLGFEGGGGDDFDCIVTKQAVPEVIGPSTAYSFKITITPKMISETGKTDGTVTVRQFQMSDLQMFEGASDTAPEMRVNAPLAQHRFNAANASDYRIKADQMASSIRGLIFAANYDMVMLALNAGGLANLQAARRDAFAFFGESV